MPFDVNIALLIMIGLPSDSTCVLKAEPGYHDIKRRDLVFYLSVYPLLNTLQTSYYDVFFFIFILIQRH